jgi:hypothetical protein
MFTTSAEAVIEINSREANINFFIFGFLVFYCLFITSVLPLETGGSFISER